MCMCVFNHGTHVTNHCVRASLGVGVIELLLIWLLVPCWLKREILCVFNHGTHTPNHCARANVGVTVIDLLFLWLLVPCWF